MGVNCLAQEHNKMTPGLALTQTFSFTPRTIIQVLALIGQEKVLLCWVLVSYNASLYLVISIKSNLAGVQT